MDTKNTSSEELARSLHFKLGETLSDLLDQIRETSLEDTRGAGTILNVIRQYVKDCNIEFDADEADDTDPAFKLAQEIDLPEPMVG